MPNQRKVNLKEFNRQIAEKVIGPDSAIDIELDDTTSIKMRLGVEPITTDEQASKDWFDAVQAAGRDNDNDAMFNLITAVGAQTPDDARKKCEKAGVLIGNVISVWGVETAAANERLGNFRYSPLPR